MRILKLLGAFALSALTFIGCNREISYEVVPEAGKTIITATLEGGNTKTYFADEKYTVNWNKGDKISVFYNEGNAGGSEFENVAENGATAKFQGTLPVVVGTSEVPETKGVAPKFWGIYPYNKWSSVSAEGVATVPYIPYQQAIADSYDPDAFASVGCSENLNLKFYNVYGLLAITIDVEDVYAIAMTSNDDTENVFSSHYLVELKAGEDGAVRPEISDIADIAEAGQEVYTTPQIGILSIQTPLIPGATYYLVVPPHVYNSGVTFTALGQDMQPKYTRSTKEGVAMKVERNKVHKVALKFNQEPEQPEEPSVTWELVESAADVVAGEYVITWDDTYYLPNSNAVSANPAVGEGITVENKKLTNTVTDDMVWLFVGGSNGFSINAVIDTDTKHSLNSVNKAQGISIKANETNPTLWTVLDDSNYGMLLRGNDGGTRNLAVYNSGSWRYYGLSDYKGTLRLYRKTSGGTTPDPEPEAVAAPVFEPAGGEVDFNTEVYLSCATDGATIYYGYVAGEIPSEEYSGKPFILTYDTTIYAIAKKEGLADSQIVSATFTVKPENPEPPVNNGSGTLEDPFNIAGAIAHIDAGKTDEVYVKGIISSIVNVFGYNGYGNATFWISDDGSVEAPQFEAYQIKYLENEDWVEGYSNIEVGDIVILYGKLSKYKDTYETSQRAAYVYSLNGKTAEEHDPVIEAADIKDVPAAGVSDATLDVSLKYAEGWTVSVQSDGTIVTAASYKDGKLTYSVAENEGEARESTITIVLTKDEANVVTKDIKVSQLAAGVVINNGSGTLDDPFNVAGAKAYIDAGNGSPEGNVYVKGKVSSVKYVFNATYGTATFNISDDGSTDSEQFTAYGIYYLENKAWVEGNGNVDVGDDVILYGTLVLYGTTYETSSKKAYVYSLNGKTSEIPLPSITANDIPNVSADGQESSWRITVNNAEGWTVSVAGDGTVVTAAAIETVNDNIYSIAYTVAANTGDAREGSITVTVAKEGEESITKVIKVSQAAVSSQPVEELVISVDFSTTEQRPESFPTSGNNTTLTTYTIAGYDFGFASTNTYKWMSGYLIFGKKDSYILLPAISDKRLTKVEFSTNSGGSANVIPDIYSNDGNTSIYGNTSATQNGQSFSWDLSNKDTKENTSYQIRVTSNHNLQLTSLKLTYSK